MSQNFCACERLLAMAASVAQPISSAFARMDSKAAALVVADDIEIDNRIYLIPDKFIENIF